MSRRNAALSRAACSPETNGNNLVLHRPGRGALAMIAIATLTAGLGVGESDGAIDLYSLAVSPGYVPQAAASPTFHRATSTPGRYYFTPFAICRNKVAGSPPPITPCIGVPLSLPTHTPITWPST